MTAVLALVLALQQTPAPTTPPPASGTPAAPTAAVPAPPRRPVPTTTNLLVRVTDRTGASVQGVTVSADGPVSRQGASDAAGAVQFRGVTSGTYRMRASGDGFITLEKEVTIRLGTTVPPIEFALSAAPPPPQPPAPPVAPAAPPVAPEPVVNHDVKAGDSRVLSIADLAERSLGGRDPMKLVPVACSGLDNSQMLVLRDTLNAPANPGVDEVLYVVAGEAMLTLNGHEQVIMSGWYAMVPRGMAHTLVRRGRTPAIILTTAGGQPCTPKP